MLYKRLIQISLILFDYALLLLSLLIVFLIRFPESLPLLRLHFYVFVPLFVLWLFVFHLFDLYSIDVPHQVTRLCFALVFCVFISVSIFYLFAVRVVITPKTNLALIALIFALLNYVWRRVFDFLYVYLFHGHEIAIGISDQISLELLEKIQKNPFIKYKVLGIIVTKKYYNDVCKHIEKDKVYTSLDEFSLFIKKNPQLKSVVVTGHWFVNISDLLYTVFHDSINIINVVNFFERVFRYIPVHGADQYWVMNNIDVVSRRAYIFLKQVQDFVLAVLLLPLFVPIMAVVAVLIKFFGGKGPIWFIQKRYGKHCKAFNLIKFRTMVEGTEKEGVELLKERKHNGDKDISKYIEVLSTQSNDGRVTKLGKFLRFTRLDELPQIFNVLLGDMSFIGPRPERSEFLDLLSEKLPHYKLRYLVKPGLSGWAQVSSNYASTEEEFEMKLCYDLFYVKNINIILDLQVYIKTIVILCTASGK